MIMNYLIKNGIGGEYYFHKPYEGICMKRCDANGKSGEHQEQKGHSDQMQRYRSDFPEAFSPLRRQTEEGK